MINRLFLFLVFVFIEDSFLSTQRISKEKIKSFDDVDQDICTIIREGCNEQVKNLLFYMENVVKLMRIYFTGVNYENNDIRQKILSILNKGGPQYFFEAATYFEETKFRDRMNLSDVDYQEYLYLRAEAKERWEAIELRMKNITC